MQLDLFQSLSRSQPGRSVDPSPGSTLMVFAVTERVEQELRRRVAQKSGPLQGIESDAFMLFHEFFEKLCDETLRYASRTSMDVWFRGRRRASRVELELIVRRILQDFYWGRPGIFARVARRNGFVAALLQFFDECREGHTSETTLQEFITAFHEEHGESVEVRVARLEELTSLFGRYERALTQLKLLDPGLTLRVALESVRDRRFPLPGMLQRDHIRFRDIYDWSPVRIDIVRELAGRMREESTRRGRFVEDHVEIHLPYDFNRPSLFHYLEPILRQIESLEGEALTICWDENGGMCLDGPGRARPLEALARSVWSEAGGVRSRLRGQEGERIEDLEGSLLTLIEAAGERREARALARHVRDLLAQEVSPGDIVIAVRELNERVDDLSRALDAYGVPWHCSRGSNLSLAPPARLVMSLISLVLQGCPREQFIEVLTSRYTSGMIPGSESSGESAYELARFLRRLGIRDDLSFSGSSQSAYVEHLEKHLEQLRRRITLERDNRAAHGASHPEDAVPLDEHPEVSNVATMRDRIVALRSALGKAFPSGKRPLAEHARSLISLLEDLRIRDALAAEGVRFAEGGSDKLDVRLLEALARDQQALFALEKILGDLARSDALNFEIQDAVHTPSDGRSTPGVVLSARQTRAFEAASLQEFLVGAGFGEVEDLESLDERERTSWGASMTLAEFADLLSHLLERHTLKVGGARGASVKILEVRDLAGCTVPHVVIASLNHGRFPLTYRSRALFTDDDRLDFGRYESAQAHLYGLERQRMSFPLQCLPYAAGTAEDVPVPARQSEEVLLFYFGLAAATESVTLSWSNLDNAGRLMLRSVFVDEVLHRVPNEAQRSVQHHEEIDPVPALDRCASPWELAGRFMLESVGDGVHGFKPRKHSKPIASSLRQHVPSLPGVQLAAHVERMRHTLGSMGNDEIQEALQKTSLARYCGQLSTEHKPWLQKVLSFDALHPLQSGKLDHFGTCPSRFWFAEILKVRSPVEVSQDVTGAERTLVVQELIQAAFEALRAEGLLPLGHASEDRQAKAVEISAEAMKDSLKRWEETRNRAHPRLWERVRSFCEGIVSQLLERERMMMPQDTLALPWKFGASFSDGPMDRGPVEINLGSEGMVFLSGRVDRLVLGDGLTGGSRIDLLKYGSSKVDAYERRLAVGKRLITEHELPMAMLAVAEGLVPRLRQQKLIQEPVMITASYESVLEGSRSRAIAAETGAIGEAREGDVIEEARARLVEQVEGMRSGTYPFATRDCAWCQYKDLCRRGTYPEG